MSMTIRPALDHERVLGQIARGEVRTGADAAREIADHHQATYGAAFDGTPAEALRRQMRAAEISRPEGDDA